MTDPRTPDISITAEVSLMVAAKASGENFPVALKVLPKVWRTHLMALYGFARLVDDIGDEDLPGLDPRTTDPETYVKTRLRLLDGLQADVGRIYDGTTPELPAIRALGETATACGIPRKPLDDLIQANRQDQLVIRYQTYDELLQYCELSANTVGRAVLHIFGKATPTGSRSRTPSARPCSSSNTGRTWPRTGPETGSTCRSKTSNGSASPRPTSPRRPRAANSRAC